MTQSSSIFKLPPEQKSKVDSAIRRFYYVGIAAALRELETEGINISRQTLWRYAKSLQSVEITSGSGVNLTLVVIVDLKTGDTTQLRSALSPDTIASVVTDLSNSVPSLHHIGDCAG